MAKTNPLDIANSKELTPQQQLAAYKKAVDEEFAEPASDLSQDAIRQKIRAMGIVALPGAFQELIELSQSATSETVRATCSKFLIEIGLGVKGATLGKTDELASLIDQLTKNDSESSE